MGRVAIFRGSPVNAFTNNPPTGGIGWSSQLFNTQGFIAVNGRSFGYSITAAETSGAAVITFFRMYGNATAISLVYNTSDGTATAGSDYTAVSGAVTWADGDSTPKSVTVPLLATSETTNQYFNFNILGIFQGVYPAIGTTPYAFVFLGGDINPWPGPNYSYTDSFHVTITRETAGTIDLVGTPYSVQRPGGTTTVTLQVQRSSGLKGAVGCSYHTTDGTALAGVAYTAQSGTLSWAAGDAGPKSITITILSGGSGTQQFTVTIDTPTGGVAIGLVPVSAVQILAGAPPTNPVTGGSVPNQIVDNGSSDDVSNVAVTVQPANLVDTAFASIYNGNILVQSYPTTGPRLDFGSTFWFSTTVGWIVGDGGWILKTSDGGATWTVQTSGTTANLYDVYFADANNGWAVGAGGVIVTTANGGTAWTVQTSGVSTDLNGVSFTSTTVGIAVGANGVILRTTNGGGAWAAQTSGVATVLNEVHYFDATHVWVVGDAGVILFSANGTSWGAQTSGVATDLNGVYFASSTVGFAVGDAGVILATTNGSTWAPQTSGTTQNLYDVNFQTTTLGWAVGAAGTILKGDGSAWVSQTSGVTVDLQGVDAASTSIAYVVGDQGKFLVTGNAGSTWTDTAAPDPIGTGAPSGGSWGGGPDFNNYDETLAQTGPLRFTGSEY